MAWVEARSFGELLPQGTFFFGDLRGGLELENDEEIAAAAGFERQPMRAKAQSMTTL
jgi:hypothetical protein